MEKTYSNIKPDEWYQNYDYEMWKYIKEEDEAFEYDLPENKHNNTIHFNKKYLTKSKKLLKQMIKNKLWDEIDQDRALKDYTNWIQTLEDILNDGYLITRQVESLLGCMSWELEDFTLKKESDSRLEFEKLEFEKLEFDGSDEKVFDLIKIEVDWRKKGRDIYIFKERKKGRLLEDIAKEFKELKDASAVRQVVKKVDGAFDYYKGLLFHRFCCNYLIKEYPDCKVESLGGKSEPDIIVTDPIRNIKTIYSIKNLKIDRENYRIPIKEIEPELNEAISSLIEYKEQLYLKLIIFDNISNKIIEKDIDFRHPTDIIIKRSEL